MGICYIVTVGVAYIVEFSGFVRARFLDLLGIFST